MAAAPPASPPDRPQAPPPVTMGATCVPPPPGRGGFQRGLRRGPARGAPSRLRARWTPRVEIFAFLRNVITGPTDVRSPSSQTGAVAAKRCAPARPAWGGFGHEGRGGGGGAVLPICSCGRGDGERRQSSWHCRHRSPTGWDWHMPTNRARCSCWWARRSQRRLFLSQPLASICDPVGIVAVLVCSHQLIGSKRGITLRVQFRDGCFVAQVKPFPRRN